MTIQKVIIHIKSFIEGWISILPFMSKMPRWRPLFTRQISSNNDWHLIGADLAKALDQFAIQCSQATTRNQIVNNEK